MLVILGLSKCSSLFSWSMSFELFLGLSHTQATWVPKTNNLPATKISWNPPPFVSVNKCRYRLDSRYGNFHVLSFDGPQLLYRLRITPSSTIYCFTFWYMAPPSKRVVHRMPGVFVFLCAKRQLLQCLGEYCAGTKQFLWLDWYKYVKMELILRKSCISVVLFTY